MADYVKLALKVTYSENSNYTGPEWVTNWDDWELTAGESWMSIVDAGTGEITLGDIANHFDTIDFVAIRNTSSTNALNVNLQTVRGGATTLQFQIPAGGSMVAPGILNSGEFTLAGVGATVRAKVLFVGNLVP